MRTAVDGPSLIHLQITLEHDLDADGLLVPFPGSTEQARFVIHRYPGGYVRYFRHDLPDPVRERLTALLGDTALSNQDVVKAILAADVRCQDVFIGASAVFVNRPGQPEFPDVVCHEGRFVIVDGDEPISEAFSVRENEAAAEAAVETAAPFRRRGYGRQVTAAWAYHVMGQGKVAFYSFAEENTASQALARSLGVVQFSSVAAYE